MPIHVASYTALRKQTDSIVADLQESFFAATHANVDQTRWRTPRKFRQAFLRRKSSHAAAQTREKCAFCGHCCGAAFIGGLKFEIKSFDRPSCMGCNEHNKQVNFMQLSHGYFSRPALSFVTCQKNPPRPDRPQFEFEQERSRRSIRPDN